MTDTIGVPRVMRESDLPALLELMRGLARFEGYAAAFAVTTESLACQGLRRTPPDFHAVVVDAPGGGLMGMAVYYLIPFTYRARPTLFLKELFVDPEYRGAGVGAALMRAAAQAARDAGCATMRWQVAHWNVGARRFYEGLGAERDDEWVDYQLVGEAIDRLLNPDDGSAVRGTDFTGEHPSSGASRSTPPSREC